jgi:hypothetical protein
MMSAGPLIKNTDLMHEPRPNPSPDVATLLADLRELRQRLYSANERLAEAARRPPPQPRGA